MLGASLCSASSSQSSAKHFTKGVNHRAKRKGRFKARFKEGSDSAARRAGWESSRQTGQKEQLLLCSEGLCRSAVAD